MGTAFSYCHKLVYRLSEVQVSGHPTQGLPLAAQCPQNKAPTLQVALRAVVSTPNPVPARLSVPGLRNIYVPVSPLHSN